MRRIAKFEKVSLERFTKDWANNFPCHSINQIMEIYENIELPKRATAGSAGYDFYSPVDFTLKPGDSIKIPTGIRVKMDEGWVLKIYPRSSLGFKYRLQIDNTIPIIDGDYFYSDNEGHIFIKLTNDSKNSALIKIKTGNRIVQGVFIEYGITLDDNVNAHRNGGLGSTDE